MKIPMHAGPNRGDRQVKISNSTTCCRSGVNHVSGARARRNVGQSTAAPWQTRWSWEEIRVTNEPPSFRLPLSASRREQREWEKQMLRWLSNQIEEQIVQENHEANANVNLEELLIELAREGHPEGLRRLYPQFADCIHSPKLRQGQRYWKARKTSLAEIAADFARRIRALWREQYGKSNRGRDEKSAEDFAVKICKSWYGEEAEGLTTEAVLAAAKPSGKHAKPRRKITRQKAEVAR
jgi:hypothetical protein